MNSQRNFFVIALLILSFMMWQAWQIDHASQFKDQKDQVVQHHSNIKKINQDNQELYLSKKSKIITVKTDIFLLKINTYGGDIEQAFLLNYMNKLGSSQPFHLLETSEEFIYQAQSDLILKNGPNNTYDKKRLLYETNQDTYTLAENQKELRVPMVYKTPDGVVYTKTFILKRNDFTLNICYEINNNSIKSLELILFAQLKQSINLPRYMNSNNFALQTYRGAAYSTNNEKYKKYSFKDIQRENLNVSSQGGGWIALLQQYFATAWIPAPQYKSTFYTKNFEKDQVAIGFKSHPIIITPCSKCELKTSLWIGPKIQDKMKNVAPYLDLVVDYGWLWFISQPLFQLLKFIHSYIIDNWGFSIILITFIVRGIMYPLTKSQYISMAKIRMLQPKLDAMRQRLSHDTQRRNKEIIELYKKEKVNPLGGCLPLIIQMPIFLALYYMLSGSIELRHAPFILWIHDLSDQDPYYILPILMGITMFLIQKMSPQTMTDPIQKKIMLFMPVIFTIFFLWFPSGLVLYYIINNIVTIIQQQIIYYGLKNKIL